MPLTPHILAAAAWYYLFVLLPLAHYGHQKPQGFRVMCVSCVCKLVSHAVIKRGAFHAAISQASSQHTAATFAFA